MKKFFIPLVLIIVGIAGIVISVRLMNYGDVNALWLSLLQISSYVLVLYNLAFIGSFFIQRPFVPIVTVLIGVACFLAFSIIGSELDSEGFVQEPFALVPLGFLFLFLGSAWLGSLLIKKQIIPLSVFIIGVLCLMIFQAMSTPFILRSLGSFCVLIAGFWSISCGIKSIKRST